MKSLFVLLSLLTTGSTFAKIIIVSDIDDTIRQSNVVNKADAAQKLLGTPKAFKGLMHLFKDQEALSKKLHDDFAITYISASYPIFYNAEEWVNLKGFPKGVSIQRQIGEDKKTFKKSNIKNFLGTNFVAGDTVLFFGDNAELDPVIYQEVRDELGLPDTDIFIRDVRVQSSRYAPVKIIPAYQDRGIVYYGADVELLAHPRFQSVGHETEKAMFSDFNEEAHLPDYMLGRVADGLKKYCQDKKAKKSHCKGSDRVRNFVDRVELELLNEMIAAEGES